MTDSDQTKLSNGICPDCNQQIRDYFITPDTPLCKNCDVYFTKQGGQIVRNTGATQQANDVWRGLVETGRWVEDDGLTPEKMTV